MVIALDKQLENYTSLLFILIWKPQPGSRGSFSQMFLLICFLENCSLFLRERLQWCHAFLVAFSITCPLGSTSLHTLWMNHRRGMRGTRPLCLAHDGWAPSQHRARVSASQPVWRRSQGSLWAWDRPLGADSGGYLCCSENLFKYS